MDTGSSRLDAINVTAAKSSLTVGEETTLTATGVFGDGSRRPVNVNWSTSNANLGLVGRSGKFSAIGAGTLDVIATGELEQGISGKASLTIEAVAPTGLRIDGFTSGNTLYSTSDQRVLQVKLLYPEGARSPTQSVAWDSSNPLVATVDGNGNFQGTGAGRATITARSQGLEQSITVELVAPNPNPIVVYCTRNSQISVADWNARRAADPDNVSEWVKVDYDSCQPHAVVALLWKDNADAYRHYRLMIAKRGSGRFMPADVTGQLSSDRTNLVVGSQNSSNSTLVNMLVHFSATD